VSHRALLKENLENLVEYGGVGKKGRSRGRDAATQEKRNKEYSIQYILYIYTYYLTPIRLTFGGPYAPRVRLSPRKRIAKTHGTRVVFLRYPTKG